MNGIIAGKGNKEARGLSRIDAIQSTKMGDLNFAQVNLQYLMKVHALAQHNPALVALMTGFSKDLVNMILAMSMDTLAKITEIQTPLLTIRGDLWCWKRILNALQHEEAQEIDVVLEHASLSISN